MSDFDSIDSFGATELVAGPYPYFDYLRTQCPVLREPHHGVVMVTGYEEARTVYTDTSTFSSCNSVTGPFPGFPVPLEGTTSANSLSSTATSCPSATRSRPSILPSTRPTEAC